MCIFKKKFFSYLYIFFFTLVLILFEFSTRTATAKIYNIYNVEIEENYDLNFDKLKVIDKAFKDAFKILIYKIVDKQDRSKFNNVSINEIKSLIETFEIIDEKFLNNNYKSKFNVQFNKKRILKYLETMNVISSVPTDIKILILPILIDVKKGQLIYFNESTYFKNWNKNIEDYFLINYILPNEDIEDYLIIKKNLIDIENYNFNEIIKKYNTDSYIILLMFKKDNQLKALSKIKFNKEYFLINRIYENYNHKDSKSSKNIILDLKEIYDDKWKSINKLNTSIALPIKLSINAKDIKLSKKIEETLTKIDLISDFKIQNFNNKKTVYKIIFNSNPDKFIEIMKTYNFSIDTSNQIWRIK